MKINPAGGPGYIPGSYRVSHIDAYRKSAGLQKRDEAVLSEEAISFSKVFAEVKQTANIRSSEELTHIAELKAQVEAGTYRIDSDKIAESILGDLYG